MDEDQIRLAFSKVKQDIQSLQNEIQGIKEDFSEIKIVLKAIADDLTTQKMHKIAENQTTTVRQINTTNAVNTTDNTTVPQEIGGLKSPNLGISTGNKGVSTDRQTDTSTDISTQINPKNAEYSPKSIESDIQEASEILDSLDRLKKEIRLKFKRVTSQEMAVFSSIYQLEESDPNSANYKQIAKVLKLSESSIRDYVQRMINKGIPIKKHKINNKSLILSISSDLKKIATLSTIIKLREL